MSTLEVEGRRGPRWLLRSSLVITALTAALTLGVMTWAGGGWTDTHGLGDVVFILLALAWNVPPMTVMALVAVAAHRSRPSAARRAMLGAVALAALTARVLWDFVASESSTAALLFIFPPLVELALMGVSAAAVLEVAVRAVLRRARGALGAGAGLSSPRHARLPFPAGRARRAAAAGRQRR